MHCGGLLGLFAWAAGGCVGEVEKGLSGKSIARRDVEGKEAGRARAVVAGQLRFPRRESLPGTSRALNKVQDPRSDGRRRAEASCRVVSCRGTFHGEEKPSSRNPSPARPRPAVIVAGVAERSCARLSQGARVAVGAGDPNGSYRITGEARECRRKDERERRSSKRKGGEKGRGGEREDAERNRNAPRGAKRSGGLARFPVGFLAGITVDPTGISMKTDPWRGSDPLFLPLGGRC